MGVTTGVTIMSAPMSVAVTLVIDWVEIGTHAVVGNI